MEKQTNGIRTDVKMGYCEYVGRNMPVFFTYSDGVLIGKECPRNGCKRSKYCKIYNSAP